MTSAAATHSRRYSYSDLATLPDDQRFEILDGELYANPSPVTKHQRVAFRLARLLDEALRGLGEVFVAPFDVVFSDDNVVQPDVLYVSKARADIVNDRNVNGAPDLVVEVLSEGTRRKDLRAKKQTYARFGVAHYWVADPDADRLEVYVLDGSAYRCIGIYERPAAVEVDGFPSVKLDLDDLFA